MYFKIFKNGVNNFILSKKIKTNVTCIAIPRTTPKAVAIACFLPRLKELSTTINKDGPGLTTPKKYSAQHAAML